METQQVPPVIQHGAKANDGATASLLLDVQQAGSDQGAVSQNTTPLGVSHTPTDCSSKPNNDSSSSSTAADTTNSEQPCPLAAPPPRRVCLEWVDAAKAGDALELRRLLRAWPSLLNLQVGGLEATAAHWSAANGHTDALQHLLEWGADVMVQTATGCLPLHSAAAAGRDECAQLLLLTHPALQQHQLTAVNEDGLTAAALALRHGHKLVQGMLLQAAASGAVRGGQAQEHELPAAAPQQQAQHHQPRPAKQAGMRRGFLLGVPAKPEGGHGATASSTISCADEPCGDAAPAAAAAVAASIAQPDSLWNHTMDKPLFGVASSPIKQQQQPPQHPAAPPSPSRLCAATLATGDTATAVSEASLDAAAPAAAAQDLAPRYSAAADSAAAANLTQQQPAPAAAIDRAVGRAWLDAARSGDLPRLQELLRQEPGLRDYRGTGTSYAFVGNSALHWAAAKGHRGCVRWLLQQGAAVGAANEAGASPLHTAVEHGQPGCAELLVLLGGGDVGAQDGYGQSVLSLAAAAGAGSSGSRAGGVPVRGEQLLLWDQAYKLRQQDRSAWGNVAMQRLLQLANKSAEAARCLEKHELVALAAGELHAMMERLSLAA